MQSVTAMDMSYGKDTQQMLSRQALLEFAKAIVNATPPSGTEK